MRLLSNTYNYALAAIIALAVACGVSGTPSPTPVAPSPPTHVLASQGNFAFPIGAAGGGLGGTYPNPTIAPGTSGQVLISNATPATTWTTLSSDVTVSATGATTVNSISGSSPITISGPALTLSSSAGSSGVAGISPSVGSTMSVTSGVGSGWMQVFNAGNGLLRFFGNDTVQVVQFQGSGGGETLAGPLSVSGAITLASPPTLACGTGGTQTVASPASPGIIVTSGTLSSNCTLDFSTNASTGVFHLDMSGVTLGATFGVVFKNGTATKTYTTAGVISGTLATVWTHGTNTLAVNF